MPRSLHGARAICLGDERAVIEWRSRTGPSGPLRSVRETSGQRVELVTSAEWGDVGGLVSDGRDGWFVSTGDGTTNVATGLGNYHHTLWHLDPGGQVLWSVSDEFDPNVPESDAALHATSLAVLEDSVIITAAFGAFEGGLGAVRYKRDGTLVQSAPEQRASFTAAVGPHAAVFLTQDADPGYTLARLDFPALTIPAGPAGAACAGDDECLSGL